MPLFCLYSLSGVTYETKSNFTPLWPLNHLTFLTWNYTFSLPIHSASLKVTDVFVLHRSAFSREEDEVESQCVIWTYSNWAVSLSQILLLAWPLFGHWSKEQERGWFSVTLILLMQYSNILISHSFFLNRMIIMRISIYKVLTVYSLSHFTYIITFRIKPQIRVPFYVSVRVLARKRWHIHSGQFEETL